MTPMMRQFHDLKKKHPDAVLLFRCGDFYETYEQDAKVVSEVLGITLTKRTRSPKGEGYMAGFPHHALDTYLPRLVRAGKRVAICDMLEPPKKLVRRGSDELTTTATNNRNNNPQTTNTTMKLSINNNTETQNTVANPIAVAAGSKPMTAEQYKEEPIRDAEAEEIKDDQPTPKKKTIKRKATKAAKATKAVKESKPAVAEQPATKKFSIVPYTNKQGETGYFLFGFTSQEEAKGLADRMAKSVREGFRYENHVRYDVVAFPPRYAQMAQQMCDALNTGNAAAVAKVAASTFDVYTQAVADGKAESDRKRAERKEAEAKAKAKEVAKVKKSAGLYSKEDVAAMLADVLAGKDVPEDIKKLLKVA